MGGACSAKGRWAWACVAFVMQYAATAFAANPITLWVAPFTAHNATHVGDPTSTPKGTRDAPFASLADAVTEMRRLRGGDGARGMVQGVVRLLPGRHVVTEPIALTSTDSMLMFAGEPGSVVSGGIQVPSSRWERAQPQQATSTTTRRSSASAADATASTADDAPISTAMRGAAAQATASTVAAATPTVWTADVTDLVVGRDLPSVHSLWLNGTRRLRVRSRLMHWWASLDPANISNPINKEGFVLPPAFPLDTASTATEQWLVVAYHQWATDVHRVVSYDPQKRALLLDPPIAPKMKYAFDNNMYGAKRFYVENAPDSTLEDGQWRLLSKDGKVELVYAAQPGEPSPADLGAVLSNVSTPLFIVNGTHGVALVNVTVGQTEWELASIDDGTRAGLSADVRSRGSGQISLSAAVVIDQATNVTIRGCSFENIGGAAINVIKATGLLVERCSFRDVGSNAIQSLAGGLNNALIQDSYFGDVGGLWRQGTAGWFSHSSNVTVTHIEAERCASDGFLFGGAGALGEGALNHPLVLFICLFFCYRWAASFLRVFIYSLSTASVLAFHCPTLLTLSQ